MKIEFKINDGVTSEELERKLISEVGVFKRDEVSVDGYFIDMYDEVGLNNVSKETKIDIVNFYIKEGYNVENSFSFEDDLRVKLSETIEINIDGREGSYSLSDEYIVFLIGSNSEYFEEKDKDCLKIVFNDVKKKLESTGLITLL